MRKQFIYFLLVPLFFILQQSLFSQTYQFLGQASGWMSYATKNIHFGVRYIPEFSITQPLQDDIIGDVNIALNTFSTSLFSEHRTPLYTGRVKPYRVLGRLSSDKFEARLGLQKINFGSATLLRPLMWFDAIDPRDPLQLTDGVYAFLARSYFSDNSNLWLWGLFGNNELKGMDIVPSQKNSFEFGGRFQTPLWNGEIAATYHHRTADMNRILSSPKVSDEDRYALDGKWDIDIGVWFEAVLVHRSTSVTSLQFQRLWTVGADYTFSVGNGLNVLTEYFRSENSSSILGSANGSGFSALSVNYPLSIVDRVSGMVYRDWTNLQWYRLVSLQRTYDNWIMYLLGYWNPSANQRIQHPTGEGGRITYSGTGMQLMIVFNH